MDNPSLQRALNAVKAQALRDAAEDWPDGYEGFAHQWLLDRAEDVERGEGS